MPAVSRLGDNDTGHDSCPPRPSNGASPNVFCNGIAVHRQGDSWASHGCPDHPPHGATTSSGSPNVYVNGVQISRIGDPVSCGSSIAEGSPNVFCNGIEVHRETDHWASHCCKTCHDSVLAKGSSTVFCNGLPVARIGDPVACGRLS